MTFRIGQEVTRKNKELWTWYETGEMDDGGPAFGEVLVIYGIETDASEIGTWLLFKEWPEEAFDACCFSPVVETDISNFTSLLEPKTRVKEEA